LKTQSNPIHQLYREHHWFLANSPVLQAWLQCDVPANMYGSRGKWVLRAVHIAIGLHLGLLMTRIIGSLDVFLWWLKAGASKNKLSKHSAIFVGFGAGPEAAMWSEFSQENNGLAVRLNQTDASTFGSFHRPRLMVLWRECWRQSASAYSFLAATKLEPVTLHRVDFFTFLAMRVAQYSFYRCWWKEVDLYQISCVVFISADTPAFACMDAGVENVEFRQHGLLRKSVLMPHFKKMKLLTLAEKKYFSTLMPLSKIVIVESSRMINVHHRTIIIASKYNIAKDSKEQSLTVLKEFVSWAEENLFSIVIRKHPKENDNFWEDYFPRLPVDSISDNFESALLHHKPMILATWFSTTLVDALRCNIVPVTISPMNDLDVQDMVLNLREHCLTWADDKNLLTKLVNGETSVQTVIACIGQGASSC
jgi:hypothetical protein